MKLAMRRSWLVWAMIAVILAVLAYAWIDGGREPVRTIAEPIPVPDLPR